MQLPTSGQLFHGKYKLQELLGQGGFAAVYLAIDVELGRSVAIKVLAPSDDGYADGIVARFMREARVIGGFQDPHTITMFEFGRSDTGLLFMVFEYVSGQDLAAIIRERGAIAAEHVFHILEQVLLSLREAHAAGVLHRDIKPANILVYEYMGDTHRVKLLDFGIAKVAESSGLPNITREGALIGTPRYMAPEQLLGGTGDPTSDLYSLGLVAYEMLVGDPAIGGDTEQAFRQQLSEVPLRVPPGTGAGDSLCRLVDRLTAREPDDRFQTVGEVLSALKVARSADERRVVEKQETTEVGPDVSNDISIRTIILTGLGAALLVLGLLTGMNMLLKTQDRAPPARPKTFVPPPPLPTAPMPVDEPPTVVAAVFDAGRADVASPIDVAPDMPTAPILSGCGADAPWTGEKMLRIEFGSQMRDWFSYLPRNYDKDRKYPVVIVLHETLRTGRAVVQALELRKVADRKGFIIVAPDVGSSSLEWPKRDGAFVRQAFEETAAIVCVDRRRVYAIGNGVGAEMARELPCHMPLSAIATAAVGVPSDAVICRAKPPVPIIRFQGTKDPFAPIHGGPNCLGRQHLGLTEVEALWKSHNGCEGPKRGYATKKNGKCSTWRCDAAFVSCQLDGGHEWAAAPRRPLQFPTCLAEPLKFPVGAEVWRFFRKRGRLLDEGQ